jgi:hypothetical protein
MIDDMLVRTELEVLTAPPRRTPDWDDVVRRAQPALRQRPVMLGIAAAVGVVVCVAATATVTGGFDRWLRGQPGKPAPREEQRRFETVNGRSYAAFPTTTKLRELIRTDVAGKKYVLWGWRSGNSLCLRLDGLAFGRRSQGCAPASFVARTSAPVVPVVGNSAFYGDLGIRPLAYASFGLAADGVSRVDVEKFDGLYRATLGGGAYLVVDDGPTSPNWGQRVVARSAAGRVTSVALADSFGRVTRRSARPGGPTRAEAAIHHPTVGWFMRHERRGFSMQQLELTPDQRHLLHNASGLGFLRLIKPDPQSDVVVGLSGLLCLTAVTSVEGGGMGCATPMDAFSRGPLWWGGTGGGSEYSTVYGVAADGVKRIVMFTADRQRYSVALKDNLFVARVPRAQLPFKLVAYDRAGRVVGITAPWLGTFRVPAKAEAPLHPVLTVRGPNGATLTLRAGRPVRGFRCWQLKPSAAPVSSGCERPTHGTHLRIGHVQPVGRDVFVFGYVDRSVLRARVRFENGDTVSAPTTDGYFLLAIPRAHLSQEQQKAWVVGIYHRGDLANRQGLGIFYKVR